MSSNSLGDIKGKIVLSVGQRDADLINLTLDAYGSHFQARGSACLSVKDIEEGLITLSEFPLRQEESLIISGGYLSDDGSRTISEHISLRIVKRGRAGKLILIVKAFTPVEACGIGEIIVGGHCAFRISYEELSGLTGMIKDMILGVTEKTELELSQLT